MDWQRFATTVGNKELAKLAKSDVFYRIPTVGAKIEDGHLKAIVPFPGIAIEYQQVLSQSDINKAQAPNQGAAEWIPYTSEIKINGSINIRAISADGIRKGRSLHL